MFPADDFDPSAYMRNPQLDVPSQIALGRQLLALAPVELPAAAQVCRKRLLAATANLAEAYKLTQSEDAALLKRPIDQRADNAWASIMARLEPYTWLDEEEHPDGARARVLLRKLFPSGLSFTQLEYGAQWAEASWRIQLLAEENHEPELRRLCGNVFVDELLRWHKEYEKMVGVAPARRAARQPGSAPRPNLAELRRQAVQAVVAWQAQLVALHLAGHPEARNALRPTDEYRDKLTAPSRPAAPPPPSAPPSPPSQPAA